MSWPEWDRRHYVWLAVVGIQAVVSGIPLVIRRNQPYIVTLCCVSVANALSFASSAWIVIFLPSLRPSFAQRLLPKQILLLSYIFVFHYLALTMTDITAFAGIPSNLEDASLVCTWTMRPVLVLRSMSDFLVLHIITGFVCLGFGLERLVSPMDKSLFATIPFGLISGIIENWLSGDFRAVDAAESARTLRPLKCTFDRADAYGGGCVFFCALAAVAAFLALMLRAIRNREDKIASALCWRVAFYLSSFCASKLLMVLIRVGSKDQNKYVCAIILNHLFGFLTVLIYIVQSKLCLTERESLALPGSFTRPIDSWCTLTGSLALPRSFTRPSDSCCTLTGSLALPRSFTRPSDSCCTLTGTTCSPNTDAALTESASTAA
eukprot:TRINITY_DN5855_c0_g1_i1.p1 TRINITY_DN5855_c0_g1~~TRINITY_DN5855_c0_g1_i1.p1  ORF type:complete len:378 (-),score=24.57 TRINITY_DN5855_c0_g1_i1:20-1153(-)